MKNKCHSSDQSDRIIKLYGKLTIYSAYLEYDIKTSYAICGKLDSKIEGTTNIKKFINATIKVLKSLNDESYDDNIFFLQESKDKFNERNRYIHFTLIHDVYNDTHQLKSKNETAHLDISKLEKLIEDFCMLSKKVKENTMFFLGKNIISKAKK